MGKPYQLELDALPETSRDVFDLDIKSLVRAAEDLSGHGLVIVASGGSQTAALYLSSLHQYIFGHACRVVTPLVFRHDPSLAGGHVWLLSAGGRNADILSAADHAVRSGARSVTSMIASRGTPLEARLSRYGASRVFAYSLPVGSDGFLATNSLWSMCLLLERAYRVASARGAALEQALEALDWASGAVLGVSDWSGTLVGLADPDTLVGLQDLEMRLTEAALVPAWVSDLRNLGHGRHYWFEAYREQARAICLYTPPYEMLARDTLALLATVSPVHAIRVPGTGTFARLASIAWSMRAALALGQRLGRDPGRPGVPEFGERLYNLVSIPDVAPESPPEAQRIVAAKLGRDLTTIDSATLETWAGHLADFRATLEDTDIRAIVSDFDGTLIETASRFDPLPQAITHQLVRVLEGGIFVGIATGRGDSCGKALREALPRELWGNVLVGYHNGAVIQPLSKVSVPDCPSTPPAPHIEQAYQRLSALVLGTARGHIRLYPTQCSLTLLDGSSLEEAWCRAMAALEDLVEAGVVRVWMSSHSIDVVLGTVSKRAVVSEVAAAANCLPGQVLTLGDRGRRPGNDTELLDHSLSLSSDECSLRLDACWNLAGTPARQVEATSFHLSRLRLIGRGMARYQDIPHE